MEEQLLTTYSFFAALIENETDIYSAVYVPMCKRALSLYAKKGKNIGTDQDIKDVILSEYGVDVPLLVIRRLIKVSIQDLSRKEKTKFGCKIMDEDNSFTFSFKSFSFSSIEEHYETERRNSNALQKAFEKFVKEQTDDIGDVPSFSVFINKYKNKISSFLTGKNKSLENPSEISFMPHVRFLQFIEKYNDDLYNVTKQIFIGSIIVSYLESNIDLKVKIGKGVSYYLDTRIVLELLDLQRAEDTQPTKELMGLIHDTGGNIRLMDITLDEIKNNMENAIHQYDKINPTTTINEACIRKGEE